MHNSQEVSNTIKSLAKSKKITIGKMLSDCSLSINTLSSMQSGGYYPRLEAIAKIADYLDCSVDYLLGRTDSPDISTKQSTIITENNTSMKLTFREIEHITKYRQLDNNSKDVVDFITERELEHHAEVNMPTYMAAHDGETVSAKPLTEAELIEIDKLADNE